MEIIAWDQETDTAIKPERFPNIGEWSYNGVTKKQYYPESAPSALSKLVDMGMLAELLPDAVILELEDFKANTGATAAKRKAAARILLIIASNRQWDVYGDDYTTLMTKLVSNTALTGPQATTITEALKNA